MGAEAEMKEIFLGGLALLNCVCCLRSGSSGEARRLGDCSACIVAGGDGKRRGVEIFRGGGRWSDDNNVVLVVRD